MIDRLSSCPLAVSMAEAQAYARVETGEEEALLAGLVRSANAYCEAFTGQVLVMREFVEVLAAGDYAIDIDARGDGWVRVTTLVEGRIRVGGQAGIASEPNGVPEPLRQGILRLVAHLFQARDGGGGEPPAAVTAMWRPYRRMRLA